MKKNWPYLLMLAIVLVVLFRVSKHAAKKQVSWQETYTLTSKSPFGCFVLGEYLDDMMMGKTTRTRGTAYQTLVDSMYADHNYVFVNDEFSPSAQDVIQLLKFVENGNNVLIAARSFGLLKDTLHFSLGDPLYYDISKDTIQTVGALINNGGKFVEANLVNPSLKLPKNAQFDHSTFELAFTVYDTAHSFVLGNDGRGYTNFISIPVGKGSFYIHTLPDAYGNYYAAGEKTSAYLFNVLSYLPTQETFIDVHYKIGKSENADTRRYVFSEPALRLGYLILIIAGLIGLFLGGRRRQRAVPVVLPPGNSTLEFVEQVGALYYNQGDHTDITWKKIAYFLESIRSRFYIQTNNFDEAFVNRLESLSGVPRTEVHELFTVIHYLRNAPSCTSKELKKLEELIRDFNTKSKR